MFARTNQGAALTRKANKALKGRVQSVKVKCGGYTNMAGGEVSGDEIEALASARQILSEAGIKCSEIVTTYKSLPPRFYIEQPAAPSLAQQ
jgi:hypothetical protein